MKVVIVEDDSDLLLTLTDVLESEGHKVQGFKKTKGVVKKLEEEDSDIALIDVKLPDGKGTDLVSAIKSSENTNGIKVYLMSASEDLTKLSDTSGADGYIKKPFGFQEILDLIN